MKLNVKNVVLIALYVSLFVVLSMFGTINAFSVKITMQNIPLYVAAMTLGTATGGFVGFLGSLLSQIISYGFTATTLLWVLPHMIVGTIVGYIFEKGLIKRNKQKLFVVLIFANVLLTILNTFVYYVDAIVYSYYTFVLIFGSFIVRLMTSVLTAIVYGIVIPPIVLLIKKIH